MPPRTRGRNEVALVWFKRLDHLILDVLTRIERNPVPIKRCVSARPNREVACFGRARTAERSSLGQEIRLSIGPLLDVQGLNARVHIKSPAGRLRQVEFMPRSIDYLDRDQIAKLKPLRSGSTRSDIDISAFRKRHRQFVANPCRRPFRRRSSTRSR